MWLVVLFCYLGSSEGNANCIAGDSACSSCSSSLYLFNSICCLSMCPTGYFQDEDLKKCILTNPDLFQMNFFELTSSVHTSIGDFEIDPTSIFPVKHRGFYFPQNSYTYSTNFILGPEFTLSFFYQRTTAGIIFQILGTDGSFIMNVREFSGSIFSEIRLNEASGTNDIYSISKSVITTGWVFVQVASWQLESGAVLHVNGDKRTVSNCELTFQRVPEDFSFGGGFEGFIYFAKMFNSVVLNQEYLTPPYFPDTCFFNFECTFCYFTSEHFTVGSLSSCTSCFSSVCTTCTGISINECSGCPTSTDCKGLPGLNCIAGGYFSCSNCDGSYSLNNGICTVPLFGTSETFETAPVIDINFNVFSQYYSVFQSGNIAGTYSPYNSPESDDPVPYKNRGLYFSKFSYLKSTQFIPLNYKFTIAIWRLVFENQGLLFNNDMVKIAPFGCTSVVLNSLDGFMWGTSGMCLNSISTWDFILFTVDFDFSTLASKLTLTLGNIIQSTSSFVGSAFYDKNIYYTNIGLGFHGYIYSLTIWQTVIEDVKRQFDICGTDKGSSCLWTCGIDMYYNEYMKSCQSCSLESVVCNNWGTGNMCLYIGCPICTGYSEPCELTTSNTYIYCIEGFTYTELKCCTYPCTDCFGPAGTHCLACTLGLYLLGERCVDECPLGFIISANKCELHHDLFISLSFDTIKNIIHDEVSNLAFTTGLDNNFYPLTGNNQPTPTVQRGYYFDVDSLVQSEAFSLNSNFTMIFYIKVLEGGFIADKHNLFLSADILLEFESGSTCYFDNVPIGEWIILAFASWKDFAQTRSSQVQYKDYTSDICSLQDSFLDDKSTSLEIGSFFFSFKGFLWKFQAFNSFFDISALEILTCSPSIQANCQWDCDYNFILTSTCKQCDISCPQNVCRRESDCSLCINPICTACDNYETCSSCVTNANLNTNSVCECLENYYFNEISLNCEICADSLCLHCTSEFICTTCIANAGVDLNSICGCNQGFYLENISNLCIGCTEACAVCDAISCNICVVNADLLDGVCICNTGYYWESSTRNCLKCNDFCPLCTTAICPGCGENAEMVDNICNCIENFFPIEGICTPCSTSCIQCFGGEYYECLTCSHKLLENTCLELCPAGYSIESNLCVENPDSVAVSYLFNSLAGVMENARRGLYAIIGNENDPYPDIVFSNVIPTYQRGVYFKGASYLSFPNSLSSNLLIGLRFFISTWVNPSSLSGLLIDKNIFSVKITEGYLVGKVEINKQIFTYKSIHPLVRQQWNHLLFAVDYKDVATTLTFYVNTFQTPGMFASKGPFTDKVNTLLLIGSNYAKTDFYTGFMYLFEIFIKMPQIPNLATTNYCNNCQICPATGICIQNCDINSYYNTDSNQCENCQKDCNNGCRNPTNCTLCIDPFCKNCQTFQTNSCVFCEKNFEIQENLCVLCNSTSYYDDIDYICKKCKSPCMTCSSVEKCVSCVENSFFNANFECICKDGYFMDQGSCVRKIFKAFLSLDSENVVKLSFSEELSRNLKTSDLLVMLNKELQRYSLEKADKSTYRLVLVLEKSVLPGDKLEIYFRNQLISLRNSLLSSESLSIELFAEGYNEIASQIDQAKQYAQAFFFLGLGSTAASSCISLNPINFFNFLNNIEIYTIFILYYKEISPILTNFLSNFSPSAWAPNVFSYLISENYGNPMSAKFNSFGNSTNLFLLNSGKTIFGFILLLLVPLFALFFKKTRIRAHIKKILDDYKFRAFLRFWVQTCLEFFLNTLIGVIYPSFASNIGILDFSISLVCFVKIYLGHAGFFCSFACDFA